MAEPFTLVAVERPSYGKSFNRTLRRSGSIPGVVYGGKEQPKKISILEKDMVKAVEIPGFSTQILKISLSGNDVDVVVKEIQTGDETYPDYKMSMFKPETTSLPIYFKEKGGYLSVNPTSQQLIRKFQRDIPT